MSTPLLFEYFQELPQRHAQERASDWSRRFRAGLKQFQTLVAGRYSEGTLQRLLCSGTPGVRQAAVVALGLCGGITISQALARMLHDEDPSVRSSADDALWSIWFRADEAHNNETLQRLMHRIAESGNPVEIFAEFEVLLQKAPKFAEAYNQRAIFHFRRGDFLRAIADCQKALQLNPYHFGAASGLAQCFMKQRKYHAALRTYRRALRLNPNLDGLRETIESLEKMLGEGRK